MRFIVEFDTFEALEAATQAVATANSATGTPDDATTPIFSAERALDSALMRAENER